MTNMICPICSGTAAHYGTVSIIHPTGYRPPSAAIDDPPAWRAALTNQFPGITFLLILSFSERAPWCLVLDEGIARLWTARADIRTSERKREGPRCGYLLSSCPRLSPRLLLDEWIVGPCPMDGGFS